MMEITDVQAIQLKKFLDNVEIPLKYNLVHTLRDELDEYYGEQK